eukprot:Skav226125  [mRNA]  locus=scaffold1047:242848:268601:- [translate_table: standard]
MIHAIHTDYEPSLTVKSDINLLAVRSGGAWTSRPTRKLRRRLGAASLPQAKLQVGRCFTQASLPRSAPRLGAVRCFASQKVAVIQDQQIPKDEALAALTNKGFDVMSNLPAAVRMMAGQQQGPPAKRPRLEMAFANALTAQSFAAAVAAFPRPGVLPPGALPSPVMPGALPSAASRPRVTSSGRLNPAANPAAVPPPAAAAAVAMLPPRDPAEVRQDTEKRRSGSGFATGMTALLAAASWGKVDDIRLLIAAGADLKVRSPNIGHTVLHIAASASVDTGGVERIHVWTSAMLRMIIEADPETPAEWAKHEKKRHHSAFLTSFVGGTFVPGRVDAAGTYHYLPEKEKNRVTNPVTKEVLDKCLGGLCVVVMVPRTGTRAPWFRRAVAAADPQPILRAPLKAKHLLR